MNDKESSVRGLACASFSAHVRGVAFRPMSRPFTTMRITYIYIMFVLIDVLLLVSCTPY